MAEKGPLSGKLLGGKYLLGDILGEGGFGTVYSAYHQHLQRTQAIKVFQERHFREPKFRDRFLREAQIVAALDHVNIVHLDDFGIEEQESRAYLVMPYVSGGTFHHFLEKQREALSLQQTTTYLEQICGALSHAHQQDVVHLDLKPLNLLMHADGRLLLSDFGLAHLLEKDMLQGGSSLGTGTPSYMAPEHFRHLPGKGSDIYALGVILYRMLTGRLPFVGDNYWTIANDHMSKPVPALQIVRPELPRGLEEVIQRALAKQVTQRYQTADELLTAFKNVLALEKEQEERIRREAEEQKQKALEDQSRKLSEQIELAKLHQDELVRLYEAELQQVREESVKQKKMIELEKLRQNELAQFYEAELQRVREELAKQKKMAEDARKKEDTRASISSRTSPEDSLDSVLVLPRLPSHAVQQVEEQVSTNTSTFVVEPFISLTPISPSPVKMAAHINLPPKATLIDQAAVPSPKQTRNPFTSHTQLYAQQMSSSKRILLFLFILVLLVGAGTEIMYTAGKIATNKAQQAAFDAYNHAAATNGVMFGFTAQHTHANPYEQVLSPTTVSELTKEWTYQTGSSIYSSPAVVNGVVYIGSWDHNLYAIDAVSGTKKWAFSTGYSSISSSPAVVNGVVYVGSFDNNLYAIDAASGTKKWVFSTKGSISSSPVVVNGVVYIGSFDHNLYAIDAVSGTKKWAFSTKGNISSSPAVVNGVVYIGSDDNNLYALDAALGTKKWAFSTKGNISSSPAVVNGVVYIGSLDHNLYAIDAASGTKKWAFLTKGYIYSSPAMVNGVVYVGSDDGNLYAIDATSGTKKWAFSTGDSILSSPVVVNGVVYVGSYDHKLYAFHLP